MSNSIKTLSVASIQSFTHNCKNLYDAYVEGINTGLDLEESWEGNFSNLADYKDESGATDYITFQEYLTNLDSATEGDLISIEITINEDNEDHNGDTSLSFTNSGHYEFEDLEAAKEDIIKEFCRYQGQDFKDFIGFEITEA
jgi:hypothetical protein